MKKATVLMLVLAFLFSSCTPSLAPGENWVRSVFAPSGAARDQACKIGYRVGQARQLDPNLAGIIDYPIGTEKLTLYTAVGGAHLYCFLFGLGSSEMPNPIPPFTTFFILQDSKTKLEDVDVSVELHSEKELVLGMINFSKETNKDQEVVFRLPEFSKQDLANLDVAKNFDVLFKENAEVKRITVNSGSGKGLF